MIKKRNKGLIFIPRMVICVVLTMVLLSNCDTLEDDAIEPVTVQNTGQGRAVLDGQSTVIDIKSGLQISVPVKTDITRQPSFGMLTALGDGLYKYNADDNATGRQDVIGYTVSDLDNKVLATDSILIDIVDQLPDSCQLIALPDIGYLSDSAQSVVDVLQNDYICDSLRSVAVSIVKAPSFGNAQVVNNEVVYQSENLSQPDELVYQVISNKDNQFSSLATVTFLPLDSACLIQLNNDQFNYDSVFVDGQFDVLSNDNLCDNDISLSIVQGPTKGQAFFNDNNLLIYSLPDTYPAGNKDSLVYQVCVNGECYTASVTITLFEGGCQTLEVNDDEFDYLAITEEQVFEVLINDQLCFTDSAFSISVLSGPFNGQAYFDDNNSLRYLYSTGEADSLTYQVCVGNNCGTAAVRFSLTNNSCDSVLTAIDDIYMVPDSTQGSSIQVLLDVTSNDILCANSNYFIDIAAVPTFGSAEVDGNKILYTTSAQSTANDSFKYVLCDADNDTCDQATVTIER